MLFYSGQPFLCEGGAHVGDEADMHLFTTERFSMQSFNGVILSVKPC